MAIEKVIANIQQQINELIPAFELFLQETVQPSVKDCENLSHKLFLLQENLAVYKHHKQNNELSPSYNLHAKVSEVTSTTAKDPAGEIPPPEKQEPPKIAKQENPGSPFSVAVNDKFRFINELFAQNSSEYHIAVEQINSLNSLQDMDIYLNSLKSVYDWKESNEVVKQFFSHARRRLE